jgi:TolA-binding protein
MDGFKLAMLWLSLMLFFGCDQGRRLKKISHLEKKSLNLARENRFLKIRLNNLKNEVHRLQFKNRYLARKRLQLRDIASSLQGQKWIEDIKGWTPQELLFVAEIEYEREDYKKSSQFFHALITNYSDDPEIRDEHIFKAGYAFYKSGENFDLSHRYFELLVKRFPTSAYLLKAKLWNALSLYKMGKREAFKKRLKEFKELYKNAPEWKILSKHYENINQF